MKDALQLQIETAMNLTRLWHVMRRRRGLPYRPSPYGRGRVSA